MNKIFLCLLFLGFVSLAYSGPSNVIHGVIRDKDTGIPLPNANIQIVGTYRGTITNNSGRFKLEVREYPVRIRVRYIGYRSTEFTVNTDSPEDINIDLQPIVIQMPEIVVTDEDPAVEIMRQVIRKKQQWRRKLENFRGDAYIRFVLENDTSIVVLSESTSEFFWHSKFGSREIIKSKKITRNIDPDFPAMSASGFHNFYDDELFIHQSRIIGPTHPDAIKHYKFKLVGHRSLDEKIVFDIAISPKNKLQPALTGQLSVLDEEFAMLEIDVRPNDAVRFPFPINNFNITFKQQFSNYGGEFWLPVDIREDGSIKIKMPGLLEFPNIKFYKLCRLTNYSLNTVLPDTLYRETEKKRIVYRNEAKQDTLITDNIQTIPLTQDEKTAYRNLDSTVTLIESFKPRGVLAGMVKMDVRVEDENGKTLDSLSSGKTIKHKMKPRFSPQIRFNRVDAYHLGVNCGLEFAKRFDLSFNGAYKTGLKSWAWGVGGTMYFQADKKAFLTVTHSRETDSRYDSDIYPSYFNSILVLSGLTDYFDYYRNQKTEILAGKRFSVLNSRITIGIHNEHHSPLEKQTDENWLNQKIHQPENPAVRDATLRSVSLKAQFGHDLIPISISEQKRILLYIEHSAKDVLSSAFDYTLYRLTADWRIPTFLKRRFMTNVLDVRLIAGTATGTPPIERYGALDVSTGLYSPFGIFKTLRKRPFASDRFCAMFWEHNFRTVPFEIIGLKWLADNNIGVILHGASGRTWMPKRDPSVADYKLYVLDKWHHEIGISLNGLFGYFRIDVTRPVEDSSYYFGLSVARIF
ncbi:carboxypeptidase-like regulatory domain-containing protein [candidate division KSB1 bacterium]|nr:carboxypeptidase-like regulatory domain-containing protein [candidate division KSB1 bacterium]